MRHERVRCFLPSKGCCTYDTNTRNAKTREFVSYARTASHDSRHIATCVCGYLHIFAEGGGVAVRLKHMRASQQTYCRLLGVDDMFVAVDSAIQPMCGKGAQMNITYIILFECVFWGLHISMYIFRNISFFYSVAALSLALFFSSYS